ncbi:MAG: hemolysin III family protein [Oscillospiraceae bacterium]|nr:hemolysin III family protein [Oscillospiraceae bacterium]
MMKRTKLADRVLPVYSIAEEAVNTATHLVGGVLGILALILCVRRAALDRGAAEIAGAAIYGSCLVILYSVSSLYHGLRPGMAKKVLQVLDHCAIYFLIAGSYSVVCLGAIRRENAFLGWGILTLEWALCLLATVLTAIDLKRYKVFSMVCYIGMGWAIIPLAAMLLRIMTPAGFWLLLLGGISYTVGAILFAIKRKWLHSIFHVFVVAGSVLQFFAFYWYGL